MNIEICVGTTCHLMGGSYMETIVEKYKSNKKVKLKYVTCFDVCNGEISAPVVKVNDCFYGDMSYEKLDDMIQQFLIEMKSEEK